MTFLLWVISLNDNLSPAGYPVEAWKKLIERTHINKITRVASVLGLV